MSRFSRRAQQAVTNNGFMHPGILLGATQLDFVKSKLSAAQSPWTTAYGKLLNAKAKLGTNDGVHFSDLAYTPHPVEYVVAGYGPATGEPAAVNDELNDAIAAYTHTLMYYYGYNMDAATRDAHAQKAIEILNAWSALLIDHTYAPPDTTTMNAPLQAGWVGALLTRAAEILRYTYTPPAGEAILNIPQFTSMLRNAFLHLTTMTIAGANWRMAMCEATIGIAVFTEDRELFEGALNRWRGEVPAIIYLTSDGSKPNLPPNYNVNVDTYWFNPAFYAQGQEGETCRDPAHMSSGFTGMLNVAETARLQGIDLYAEEQNRIATGLEANAGWLAAVLQGTNPPPGWPGTSPMADPATNTTWKATFELAYDEFVNRLGMSMPNLTSLMTYTRASSYIAAYTACYEQLTFYGTP